MKLSDFDYYLPRGLIAQYPARERDSSRLLILDRKDGRVEHTIFKYITDYLTPSDLLVLNNTSVFPARLIGRKKNTGGMVEVFLLKEMSDEKSTTPFPSFRKRGLRGGRWEVLVKCKGDKENLEVIFGEGDLECGISGSEAIFKCDGDMYELLEKYGKVPLPPYIKRDIVPSLDYERYQTVYAEKRGAVAAPTAGLHFTKELLEKLEKNGTDIAKVTLHVGYGTFKPVKNEIIKGHKIDPEYYEITESEAEKVNSAVKSGKRIIAAGTTTVRALESSVYNDKVNAIKGYTNLFIYNGFNFRIMKGLITNFHLPKSTLLMLVCAFAGRDLILNAYHEAIKKDYRFYSYGDAMLII
ncbi:MAG: tRNA preQ1(34) S-adenosylmethionine ribosyltransferase-isomerase QueA [Nitrospinota bacterium]